MEAGLGQLYPQTVGAVLSLLQGLESWLETFFSLRNASNLLDGWITLDVDVESSAERGPIAQSSTLGGVICLQSVKTNVRLGARGGVKILECLVVDGGNAAGGGRSCCRDGSGGSGSHRVEGRISVEC